MSCDMAIQAISEIISEVSGEDISINNPIDSAIEYLNDIKDPFKGLEDELF